ncbi:phosphohydrolase [Archangium sp.]|uniref:phosphohydrolase n=1 Tax=Archangium sp. TaxID=1872627 RepID=UPI002D319051|nr:phosphohydrolase [Archangium sp.]HYO54445.1 phosphohydrolase [Archangium sp.]
MELQPWEEAFTAYLRAHPSDDGSHDLGHVQRVWRTALHILQGEEADALVVLAGCFFHDIVTLPKNHPERHRSSALAAQRARTILVEHFPRFPRDKIPGVEHAILAHSFSAGICPTTIEACIVQDADRMEALGAIGLARVFYVAGRLNQSLFDAVDPLALHRELDDKQFALDHFQQKLLKLPATMQTRRGRELAEFNAAYLKRFMAKLVDEIRGESHTHEQDALERLTMKPDGARCNEQRNLLELPIQGAPR